MINKTVPGWCLKFRKSLIDSAVNHHYIEKPKFKFSKYFNHCGSYRWQQPIALTCLVGSDYLAIDGAFYKEIQGTCLFAILNS